MKYPFTRLSSRISRILPERVLWILIAVFVFYFLVESFSRHTNFYSLRLDLGNMDQTVWNVLKGNGFVLTDPMGTQQLSRMAVHADFLLVLLAPFYLIWSDPRMLLIIQTAGVALGALPLFWIARDVLKNRHLALGVAAVYLLYPPLERMMMHDFHAVALATTFLLFAYWYLMKDRPLHFMVFGILAGLTKEQIWVTVGFMSLYMAFRNRRWRFGIVLAAVSFALFYYLFWVAIPAAAPSGRHFAISYLSDFGDRQNAILKNIVIHPWHVVETVFKPDRLWYYVQLLLPVAFLPLGAPLVLFFSTPSLIINILSNNNLMRVIDYQYTSDITPFIFIASVFALRKLMAVIRKPGARKVLFTVLAVFVAVASVAWGEQPGGLSSRMSYFLTPPSDKKSMLEVVRRIGPMYTVSATNNMGAQFSERQYLYTFPIYAMEADYAVVMLGDQYAWPSGDAQRKAVDDLLKSPDHELIAQEGNFYAFKRIAL